MKFDREVSSGGVVYKKDKESVKIALIARKKGNVLSLSKGEIWCLPKGKIEKGESPDVTALREIEEETGLKGEIERKLDDIKYYYYSKEKDTRYFKVVSFYLVRHIGGSTHNHDSEVDDCKWFPIDEALKAMSYKSEREIVEKAKTTLQSFTE